jgi:hypothetical protein
MTQQEAGDYLGVTRAAVSLWMIEAGKSQRARRNQINETKRALEEQENLRRRQERDDLRAKAVAAILMYSDRYKVTPYTLGQWVLKSGTYVIPRRPRRDAKLPARWSPEGDALAAEIVAACEPYSCRHIARAMMLGKL